MRRAPPTKCRYLAEAGTDIPEPRMAQCDDWLPTERLAAEHQAIGFYLSGHPLDDYAGALKRKKVLTLAEIEKQAKGGGIAARIAGAVSSRQERKSARGNRFAFVQLSDSTGLYEVTVFSEALEAGRQYLEPGQNVVIFGRSNHGGRHAETAGARHSTD